MKRFPIEVDGIVYHNPKELSSVDAGVNPSGKKITLSTLYYRWRDRGHPGTFEDFVHDATKEQFCSAPIHANEVASTLESKSVYDVAMDLLRGAPEDGSPLSIIISAQIAQASTGNTRAFNALMSIVTPRKVDATVDAKTEVDVRPSLFEL